jgi:hypothetical protein
MEISIEKVSNGFVIKKFAADEFREENIVRVAVSFKDVVVILKDWFYGEKQENDWDVRVRDWDMKAPDMTKD